MWRRVGGEKPVSDAGFAYAGFGAAATLVIDYSLEEVGKTVWYRARRINTRNDPGPGARLSPP
jgi:hypothetical protein